MAEVRGEKTQWIGLASADERRPKRHWSHHGAGSRRVRAAAVHLRHGTSHPKKKQETNATEAAHQFGARATSMAALPTISKPRKEPPPPRSLPPSTRPEFNLSHAIHGDVWVRVDKRGWCKTRITRSRGDAPRGGAAAWCPRNHVVCVGSPQKYVDFPLEYAKITHGDACRGVASTSSRSSGSACRGNI